NGFRNTWMFSPGSLPRQPLVAAATAGAPLKRTLRFWGTLRRRLINDRPLVFGQRDSKVIRSAGRQVASRSFRPIVIRSRRERLIGTEIAGPYFGKDEILRRDRAASQATQQGELSGVGHSIGKRALQELLGGDAAKLGAFGQQAGQIGEHLVKVRDGRLKVLMFGRAVAATDEIGPGIAQDAVHM